ncbi:MAG: HAMP domain-containing protein [Cyclobacteriaceae bacterium]|nr:HAMP domain-containing protein [Cyclobacteriaceae bacterium]
MSVSFKNRIALFFLTATAVLVALVFVSIFYRMRNQVYAELEYILNYEAVRHEKEIMVDGNRIRFINKAEMQEREHREVEVNPIFIQLTDANGNVHDRSPNLKEGTLLFQPGVTGAIDQEHLLNGKRIRQRQIPIIDQGKIVGYIVTAVSGEHAHQLVSALQRWLLVLYPIVLLILFGVTRWLAGKSIQPVTTILQTTNRITENNLSERIPLPDQRDELFQLTSSINQLLARIESAMEREKQFTADASHELRTPLSVLRGTLEVLLRKPRTSEEYVEKIELSIKEIDRMHLIVEQLLMLARLEHPGKTPVIEPVVLKQFLSDLIRRQRESWSGNDVQVDVTCAETVTLKTDAGLLEVILDNLLSNAVKYSPHHNAVQVVVNESPQVTISVRDSGIGIREDDLQRIFQPFYRAAALEHKTIKGTGLGLSLVQKACDQLGVELQVVSEVNKGSTFTLWF